MPTRSPLQGFNHNIRHNGRRYHVQTEDSGSKNPHVFTHLYHGGIVISTMKFDYTDLTNSEENYTKTLRKMMQDQHKAIMKTLRAGNFDKKISQIFGDTQADMAGAMAVEGIDEQLSIDEVIAKPQSLTHLGSNDDKEPSPNQQVSALSSQKDKSAINSELVNPGAAEAEKTLIVLKDKATKESSSPWRYVAPRAKLRTVRRVTYGIKPISGGFVANTSSNATLGNQATTGAQSSTGRQQARAAGTPAASIPPSDDSRSLDQVILDYLADDDG